MSEPVTAQRGTFELITSPGPAAIAVIRVCGPAAETFLRRHVKTHSETDPQAWTVGRVFRRDLLDQTGSPIDDMLVSVHAPAPTWEVRLHLHGSPGLVRCCTDMLREARLSEQRETVSTLWPSQDTIQAEAHALLPRMLTLRGVKWLLRQSRLLSETLHTLARAPDVEAARERCREIIARRKIFDWFARPLRVALVGPPNAGKSTLANALADRHVSIVSPVPGTTRDWVETPGEIDGFPVLWLDTAGLRSGGDELEAEGVRRTRHLMASADAVLLVLDATASAAGWRAKFVADHADLRPACVALNKADLAEAEADVRPALPVEWRSRAVSVSAVQRTGLDALTGVLLSSVGYDPGRLAAAAAFTDRQAEVLEAAAGAGATGFSREVLRCLGREHSN